jgi:hypothetical protein
MWRASTRVDAINPSVPVPSAGARSASAAPIRRAATNVRAQASPCEPMRLKVISACRTSNRSTPAAILSAREQRRAGDRAADRMH